jgi:hypothetical protein
MAAGAGPSPRRTRSTLGVSATPNQGIGIVPLVKGCIDGRFVSAVNVSLEQVVSGMGDVEGRGLPFRKTVDESSG